MSDLLQGLKEKMKFDEDLLRLEFLKDESFMDNANSDGGLYENQRLQAIVLKEVGELVERMHQLGQAMPPNPISMEIQRALTKFREESGK